MRARLRFAQARLNLASVTLGSAVALAAVMGWPLLAASQSGGTTPAGVKSVLGSYMSGRVARSDNDAGSASNFYTHALTRDPTNGDLLTRAFEMSASEGDFKRATDLAEKTAAVRPEHQMSRAYLGIAEFKRGNFAKAEAHFKMVTGFPVADLSSHLARAWVKQAEGKTKEALDLLEQPKQPEPMQFFYRYHRALIADVAGRTADARAAFERLHKSDGKSLRVALAYAQHASNNGDNKTAQATLQTQLGRGDGHPTVRAYLESLEAGDRLQLLVGNVSHGMAEVFYGIGEELAGEGGLGIGALYLQYALYLEPTQTFALATLASVFEGSKKYDLAIKAYERVPRGTPLETAIEIRKAQNLNQLDKVDEAQRILEDIATREPGNLVPLDTLGAIMRGHKRFDEAITYYSRAIATIAKPEPRHWSYYYFRGTCYERTKRWPQAEADLQIALKLAPDQPMILNYLGYSWVDQNRNLKQGMALIEKAVKLKPDDGYIVDSLGWAHFKQGNFKDATRWLERAVELRPEDPVLNDHLGDAYWRIGREREARFQWEQALTLKPEPEDIDKINKKLKAGLPALAVAKPVRPTKQTQAPDPQKRRRIVKTQENPVQ